MRKSTIAWTAGCWALTLLALSLVVSGSVGSVAAGELSVEDFKFDGPLGSQGATIERVDRNHFKISLGHAPNQPTWCNMLNFEILRNAQGNALRLDVEFTGGDAYRFNHNSATWSYDARNWQPIRWRQPDDLDRRGDSLFFPEFTEDVVYFGAQVPMSYEEMVELKDGWATHPHATLHMLGHSLDKRKLLRLEITDPDSPHPPEVRWGHWIGNQHPGEHNAQWRMAGMVDWLLSDAGADFRQRSVCHFVFMTSPDGPSNGWYRVNGQGVDMNRSYFPGGADPERQAHEAYIVQKDLERLMATESPPATVWSMHTWGGQVEPILLPGPEMGSTLGPWEEFKDILLENDPGKLVKPLATRTKPGNGSHWNNGPFLQFGVSSILCEGSGDWTSKQKSLDAGAILMKSIAEYYAGTRPARPE